MKKRIVILSIIIGAVIVFYVYPTPRHELKELYKGNDPGKIASLDSFRSLPLKSLHHEGLQWKYLTLGEGEESILFLHGMAGSYDIWWQQILAVKSQYRIVAVTYPPAASLKEMGDAVNKIMDAEHVNQFHVIGSSLGGYFAQYLKTNYPDRVQKAIFANTFPPNNIYEEKNGTSAALARYLPEWLLMIAFRSNIRKEVLPASENFPLLEAYLLQQSYGGMSKQQFLARYHCVVDKFKPLPALSTSKDILIIESDNDPLIFPELRQGMKDMYTSADVFTFHNNGHFPYLNDTEEYNALVRDFFARP